MKALSRTCVFLVLTQLGTPLPSSAKSQRIRTAVLDCSSVSAEAGSLAPVATDALSQLLTQLKRFQVIERAALAQILKEQSYSGTGMMDDASAAKVGKLAGVEQIVLGQITVAEINQALSRSTGTNSEGVTVNKYFWDVKGKVTLAYRFVEVESGEVSAQGTRTKDFFKSFPRPAPGQEPTATPTAATGESESVKMMKMMLEHQEEMERIKAGQGAKPKAAGPSPTPPPSLWTTYASLGQTAVQEAVAELSRDIYNAFPLQGQITAIQDAKNRRCVIDLGASLGVKKGDDFDFLDGNGLVIGQMEVKEPGEAASVAKYQKDERVKVGVKVKARPRKAGIFD